MILVGSSIVVSKPITQNLPVFTANALIALVASLVLVPLMWSKRSDLNGLTRRTWFTLIMQAVLGVFLFRVFLFYGLRFTGAAEGGIITSSAPAFIAILSWLFLKERLGLRLGVAVVLTVLGVGILTVTDVPQSGVASNILLGNLLILGAVVCEALFTVLAKAASSDVPAQLTATTATVISFILFLLASVVESQYVGLPAVSPSLWLLIFYYALFPTALGYFLWFWGVGRVSGGTAAVFTGVLPVTAVILSYMFLGEAFRWAHLVGGLAVLLAIGLAAYPQRQKQKVSRPSQGIKEISP